MAEKIRQLQVLHRCEVYFAFFSFFYVSKAALWLTG